MEVAQTAGQNPIPPPKNVDQILVPPLKSPTEITVKPNTPWTRFQANISVTVGHIDMGSSVLGLELKNWQLNFFALVTFGFDFEDVRQKSSSLGSNE